MLNRRIRLSLAVLTLSIVSAPAIGGGYYGPGYYGAHSYSMTLNCRDDRALQRQLDQIRLSCSRQLSACQDNLSHQRTAYQHLIYKQQAAIGEQAEEIEAADTAADGGADGGASVSEYEALQQDYQRLMKAYHDLEREHRALKRQTQ